jgi:hypothetical protein
MQEGVFLRIMSQAQCHEFCGFNKNLNFVITCRMENQLGIIVLSIY